MRKISIGTKGFLLGLAFGFSAFMLIDYMDFLCPNKNNKQNNSSESGIGGYWNNVGNYLNKAIYSHEKEQTKN